MHLPSREQLGSIRYHQQRLHGTGVSPSATPPVPNNTPASTPSSSGNNTPATTPSSSATNSPTTVVNDSNKKTKKTKKTKKMAKQNTNRPEKRHLVRWTDEMDKKLLLAIQYQCNLVGVGVPWTEVGGIMGEGITGGAVIQHLAKLRIRMVAQGLPVPPPLRRGGGSSRIATSAPSSSKAKATPTKNGKATQSNTKSTAAKPKKAGKKAAEGSDDSDEEEDSWSNDDSDADFGEPSAKRVKAGAKGPMRRSVKMEDSDGEASTPSKSGAKGPMRRNVKMEDSDGEASTPSKPPKRKHQSSKSSSRKLSAYGTTDINGVPIHYDSETEDEDDANIERVAAGAPWLALEDDYPSHPNTGHKTPSEKKSLVVSLPSTRNAGMVEGTKDEETGNMSDDESEDEVVGGGLETCVDGILSEQQMQDEFSTPINQDFQDFPVVHESASNSAKQDGMYNSSYHAGSQAMPSHGDFFNDYNHSSAFEATDDLFGNGGLVQNQAMGQLGAFESGNFDMGQMSTDFNDQNTGDFGDINDDFGVGFQTSGDVGMFNGVVQQGVSNNFGDDVGGPSFSDDHNRSQNIPYHIQTSWASSYAAASNQTSVNQTPAGTSAGVDAGAGYFGNSHFDLGSFEDANIDYSGNDGANDLFEVGHLDGNFLGGGMYGSDSYSN